MSTTKPRAAREGDLGRLQDGRTGPAIKASNNVLINGRRALRAGDSGLDSKRPDAKKWDAKTGAPSILINNQPAHRLLDVVERGQDVGKTITSSIDTLFGNFVAKEDPKLHPISIVLYDMPGPLGAPLANMPWILRCAGVQVATGVTGTDGKVVLDEKVSRYHVYELVVAGFTTILMVMDIDLQLDAAQSSARLSSLGYNPELPTTVTTRLASTLNLFKADEESQGVVLSSDEEVKKRLKDRAGF